MKWTRTTLLAASVSAGVFFVLSWGFDLIATRKELRRALELRKPLEELMIRRLPPPCVLPPMTSIARAESLQIKSA